MKPKITIVIMKENNIYYLGLGTNLGDRPKNLQIALTQIAKFSKIIKKSNIYESEPVGYKEQGKFLNMVIEISSQLEPKELIIQLQEIEHKMGRIPEIKNGPRIIDLDILLSEDKIVNIKNLKIPHPRLHLRNFVLTPLTEINPTLIHPIFQKTIKSLLKNSKKLEKITLWTNQK